MTCYVALGSNLHRGRQTPFDILSQALWMCAGEGLTVTAQSRWYATPAYPSGNGPDYLNAVAAVESQMTAAEVLDRLHRIEAALGRERSERWASRVVDLDLLAMGEAVAPNPDVVRSWIALGEEEQRTAMPSELILPHPRLQERAFVLVPLNDIAPDWTHPILGRTVRDLLDDLPPEARDGIREFDVPATDEQRAN